MSRLGIKQIASYIPEARISNFDRKEQFSIDDEFIREKIGIHGVSRKSSAEETSDLCVKAFDKLATKLNKSEIEVVVVVTQNPDHSLPHTSAIVHQKLALPDSCACFDISLGCSGFVYGLSVIQSFMESNGMKCGLLFTADPYSKVMNENDKNTALLFGDAAAVAVIGEAPIFSTGKFTFGTVGEKHKNLIVNDGVLSMNGREIFNFAAQNIPKDVQRLLELNQTMIEEIDLFVFHPGSKFIVDTIERRLDLPHEKVVFAIKDYGNTVSSSIPISLEPLLVGTAKNILLSGFGVGLSWSSVILRRNELG